MTVSKNAMGVSAVATPSTKSTPFAFARRSRISRYVALATFWTGKCRAAVVPDRVDRHPVLLVEFGVVRRECAQDHGVAGPGGQQIVDLLAQHGRFGTLGIAAPDGTRCAGPTPMTP